MFAITATEVNVLVAGAISLFTAVPTALVSIRYAGRKANAELKKEDASVSASLANTASQIVDMMKVEVDRSKGEIRQMQEQIRALEAEVRRLRRIIEDNGIEIEEPAW